MEIEITRIDFDADVYDVRKAIALTLHGPDLFDPNDPDNHGRKPNFEIEMGKSPAGRIHNGKAILRVATKLGGRLLKWNYAQENGIVINGRALRLYNAHQTVSPNVKKVIEKALFIDPDQDKLRTQLEDKAREVRLRIAKLQFGVWYKPSNSPGKGRSFSIEDERDFLQQSAAYVYVVYEHKFVHIDVSTRTQSPRQT
jgi:RNA-dependent RNA polymerase